MGHRLSARLNEINPPSARIIGTVDKDHNPEIAKRSDMIVISVQPQYVKRLFTDPEHGIKRHLLPDANILSFAAGVPLKVLEECSGRPAARGIVDSAMRFAAFIKGTGFSEKGYEWLFDNLAQISLHFEDEEMFDTFILGTVQVTVAFLYANGVGRVDPERHLQYMSERLQMDAAALRSLVPAGNPNELLKKMATKGGVTEAAIQALQANPNIAPAELFELIKKRNRSLMEGNPS